MMRKLATTGPADDQILAKLACNALKPNCGHVLPLLNQRASS